MEIFNDNKDELTGYAKFMDFICTSTVKQSLKDITSNNLSNEQIADSVRELRMSISQAVQDDIIDQTKDWSIEQLIEMLTEIGMTHGIDVMEKNPQYKTALVIRLGIFGK